MALNVDVDPRYPGGYPGVAEAKRHNTEIVRMLSLPQNEAYAGAMMQEGIEVLGIITGESYVGGRHWRDADPYVLPSCSALQIGNEPMMGHGASFPEGGAPNMIQLWERVRTYVRVRQGRTDLPLVGPGIWMQRPELWASVRPDLNECVAGAVHVYEGAGDSFGEIGWLDGQLADYASIAPDLPLWCTEFTARWPELYPVKRTINRYCDIAIWAHYGHGVPGHGLVGTTEFQLHAVSK